VGKSTCGPILAGRLGWPYVDLDVEFMRAHGDIARFVAAHGYSAYCRQNLTVFETCRTGATRPSVFALSSSFVVYETFDPTFACVRPLLARTGVQVLLMPAPDLDTARDIVIRRLAERRPIDVAKERRKFAERFALHADLGDLRIIAAGSPDDVVDQVVAALQTRLGRRDDDQSRS
jgi:shikimate kinase